MQICRTVAKRPFTSTHLNMSLYYAERQPSDNHHILLRFGVTITLQAKCPSPLTTAQGSCATLWHSGHSPLLTLCRCIMPKDNRVTTIVYTVDYTFSYRGKKFICAMCMLIMRQSRAETLNILKIL